LVNKRLVELATVSLCGKLLMFLEDVLPIVGIDLIHHIRLQSTEEA